MYSESFTLLPEYKVRKLLVYSNENGDKDFYVGNVGINSHAGNLILWRRNTLDEVINVQIGNFVSMGLNINCIINLNHYYRNVTTSNEGFLHLLV